MSSKPPQLPPKQDVAMALLQSAPSVYVHLDPRSEEVLVPSWFKKQPQLVLQIGLNMAVQIPDLDVSDDAITCTLSFNRSPEFCRLPWEAIYGLVGEDGRGMVWPESVPAEVAAAADGRSPVQPTQRTRRPKLRVASSESDESPQPAERDKQTEAQGSEELASEASTEVSSSADEAETGSEPQEGPGRDSTEKGGAGDDSSASPGKKKRNLPPYLRVVK